jgi:hypothetical protein
MEGEEFHLNVSDFNLPISFDNLAIRPLNHDHDFNATTLISRTAGVCEM